MVHSYIDDRQIAEHYALNRLSPEERDEFEEHLIACTECQDRVEAASNLAAGLRAVGRGNVRTMPRRSPFPWRAAGLIAASLFVCLTPAALLYQKWNASRQSELASRHTADALREQVSQLEARLRQPPPPVAVPPPPAPAPQTAVPVYALEPVRGAGDEPSGVIHVPRGVPAVLVSIPRDSAEGATAADLFNGSGVRIWSTGPLPGGDSDSLGILIPSEYLKAGRYALRFRAGSRQVSTLRFDVRPGS
jgi:hypothetical protein